MVGAGGIGCELLKDLVIILCRIGRSLLCVTRYAEVTRNIRVGLHIVPVHQHFLP